MRCFNQTIALFQSTILILFYNPLPRLEFLKKIKLFNIYRFNNIYILFKFRKYR